MRRHQAGGSGIVAFDLAGIEPASPQRDAKRRLADAVEAARDEIVDLSHRIHAHPESAFEERYAATAVAEVLRAHGFEVEHPAGRLETAVRARIRGGRPLTEGGGARVGILAEYDALPDLGHGCGHNTMAASGVGAALALAALVSEIGGGRVFLCCPPPESGAGEQVLVHRRPFAGVQAGLPLPPPRPTQP